MKLKKNLLLSVYVLIVFALIFFLKYEPKTYKGLAYNNLLEKDYDLIKKDTKELQKIYLHVDTLLNQKIRTEEIIDSIYEIKLETSDNFLIGAIDEVIVYNDYIFILDIYKSKSVFVFDKKGKFLNQIGKKLDYLRPESIDIDKKNNQILIFDNHKGKIIIYDFKGKLINEIKFNLVFQGFKILDSGNIFLLCGHYTNDHLGELKNKEFYITDKTGSIISYGPENTSQYNKIKYNLDNNFLSKNKNITYSYRFSDTIFKIDKRKVNALYNLEFINKKHNFQNLFGNKNEREFIEILKEKKFTIPFFMGKHFFSDNHLLFEYFYKNRVYFSFYDLNNNKLKSGSIIEDKNSIYRLETNFCGTYENYFITSKDEFHLNKKSSNLQLNIKNHTLIFYKLKNFE
tara:strand:+ start:1176 stop:2375 length:1200 start_codon:yes stop_codon:yes gene_type:complete